jgi:hypothetical protein
VTSSDRSGQAKVTSYNDIAVRKCLFLSTSGGKKAIAGEVFDTIFAFYADPTVDIDEGDKIVNIKDKSGHVVEEGPFEIISVKRVPGLNGRVHHLSCKLKGLA